MSYALADFFNYHDLLTCQYNLSLISFDNIKLTPSIFIAPFHQPCTIPSTYQVHTTDADHEIALDNAYQLTSIKLPNTDAYLYQPSQVNADPVQLQSDIYHFSQTTKAQCSNIVHDIQQRLKSKFDTPLTRLTVQPITTINRESQTTLTTIHACKQISSSPTNLPSSSTVTSTSTQGPTTSKTTKLNPPLPSQQQAQTSPQQQPQ